MAKVKGPLFSLKSSGAIAKELVYLSGAKTEKVREHVIPKNPQTVIQQGQRGYLKDANTAWKTDGYNVLDIEAWRMFAGTKKIIQSGYNAFISLKINASKESKAWTKLKDCIISDVTGEGFIVNISVASDESGKLYLGTSKRAMYTEVIGVFDTDKYTFTIENLEQRTDYFFYVKNTAVGEVARTGIYHIKSGGPSLLIDVGDEAIDRADTDDSDTYVSKGNPANKTGKLTSVEIYAKQPLSNVRVATFFVVSGNNLSTRAYEIIGAVPGGSKQIIGVDIDIVIGDYIGIYFSAGYLERDASGGSGQWGVGGNKIPCVDQLFFMNPGFATSLKGLGVASS